MTTRVLVLAGPTAAGKTAAALAVAERFDAAIVSADAMQVYRGMDIGTGKATTEEQDTRAGVDADAAATPEPSDPSTEPASSNDDTPGHPGDASDEVLERTPA